MSADLRNGDSPHFQMDLLAGEVGSENGDSPRIRVSGSISVIRVIHINFDHVRPCARFDEGDFALVVFGTACHPFAI